MDRHAGQRSGLQVRHLDYTAVGSLQRPSAPSLLDTSPHLVSDASSCFFATHSTPKHRTPPSAALSHAGHDCCCARPQSCCALPSLSHHTDPIRCPSASLACCSRLSLPPSRPPALTSPIYPSQVRLVAAACCFVPVYRGRLFYTGRLLEERGGGLFKVFEISYRSATPQSAVL